MYLQERFYPGKVNKTERKPAIAYNSKHRRSAYEKYIQ
jgi:hypothetical protein